MAPQDLLRRLRDKPFVPFRLFLTDGKTYDVTEETYAVMMPTELVLGFDLDDSGLPKRGAYISPNHVVRVEPLATTATG